MSKAIYPATFDPITNGHVDIAERAAKIFSELHVGVYDRPLKSLLFSTEERLTMARKALAHLDNVFVHPFSGLTVHFAKEQNAQVIVRGLRAMSDFEWELQLSLTNKTLEPDIETMCMMANQEYSFLSSSILKDVASNGGDIDKLAPAAVVKALRHKFMNNDDAKNSRVKSVSWRD